MRVAIITLGIMSSSYFQILRSSSIIGGAQVINLFVAMIRTKLLAVLLGPAGVGLLGMYQSIVTLTGTIASMGLQTSAVRDVASSYGAGDLKAMSRTVVVIQRASWLTGLIGGVLVATLAPWVSAWTFGSRDYAMSIRVLAISILFGNVANAQAAVIQGTRRIGDLARVNLFGSISGAVAALLLYSILGKDGIVPAIVAISAIGLLVSTYFSSRVPLANVRVELYETLTRSISLFKFGISLVAASFISALASYLIRTILTDKCGLNGVGVYTAAFSLSGMFVQFILAAMGTDFYPRLTEAAQDDSEMVRLINEQAEVGILLAFPGLLGTLAFAPVAIQIFYSQEFTPAVGLLRWFVVGSMLKVLSWPLGYLLLAKARGGGFLVTEAIFHVVHTALVFWLLNFSGIAGAAMAFALMNLLYLLSMLFLSRVQIGYRASNSLGTLICWMCPVVLAVFIATHILSPAYLAFLGIFAAVASGVVCLRQILARVGNDHRLVDVLTRVPGISLLLRDC